MKKIKLNLNESLVTNTNSNAAMSDLIEDVKALSRPDYQIIDITVIPDEEYNPTIQSILIDLDESNRLCESEEESKNLSINILSETVNTKTGYSNSLFEFENNEHTITLSLVLQETERIGVYKVEAYTTKGEKVFESNTYKPKHIIESYLNSLANEYLISKTLNEADLKEDAIDNARADTTMSGAAYDDYMTNFGQDDSDEDEDHIKDDVKRDLNIEPGSDEEQMLDDLYDDYYDEVEDEEDDSYEVSDFIKSLRLVDEIKSLNINYSNWNNLSDKERIDLVTPQITSFYNKHKTEFIKSPDLFNLVIDTLTDDNFHTEAGVLKSLNIKEEE